MTPLRVQVIDQLSELAPLLDFWSCHARTPLQSPAWMLAWWSEVGAVQGRLQVLAVRAGEQWVGLAPCYARQTWIAGKSLRWLGSGQACTDFQSLIAAPGWEAPVGQAIASQLSSSAQAAPWSLIECEGAAPGDPAGEAFAACLQQRGWRLNMAPLEHTWRLDVSGGWAGFLRGLSQTQRNQTRNLINRFDKNDALQLRTVKRLPDVPAALQACMELHQRRWQASGHAGCFANPRFTRFLQAAAGELASAGKLSLTLLEEHGRPIAAHLALHDAAGNQFIYQSGRDPARDAERIGRILTLAAIRAACDQGIEFIDFLRGDEIYKHRLGAQPTACLRLRWVSPHWLPRLRDQVRSTSRQLKQHLRQLRPAGRPS